MNSLESRIADLSPVKRDLLLQRLRQQQEESQAESLTPRWMPSRGELNAPFPLSGIQQAYWAGRSGLFDLGAQGANGYFELHFTRLGEDGVRRLNAAFQSLIERHPMLRIIVLPDGRQQILDEVPVFEFQVNDLRRVEAGEAESRLAAIRGGLRTRRAPLDQWPLFEIIASLLADGEVRLQIRFELVVLDGVTRFILFREWFQLFRDPVSALPPLECTYREFVTTWTGFRASEGFRRSRDYWLARLTQMPPAPELPLARKVDPLTPSHFVNHVARTLEQEDWSRLRDRASRSGLTPTSVVLAAFADVLGAWSRIPEFSFPVLGTFNPPIHPQIERIVGNFNSLTLLTISSREGSFEARARRLQEQVTTSLDHQSFLGFEVVREINRRRGETSNVAMPILFDSLLELGHQRYEYLHSGGLGEEIQIRYVDHAGMYVPQFQLIGMVAQFSGTLFTRWQVIEGLYPVGLVHQMAEAYSYLLQRLAREEGAWQAGWSETLQMLLERPGAGPIARWSSEVEPVPEEILWTSIALRAAEQPETPALIGPGRVVLYRELAQGLQALEGPLLSRLGGEARIALGARRAATFLEVNRLLELRPKSRVLATAPAGSEAAAWEVFGTLAAGATLVLPAPETVSDRSALARCIAEERPTVWSTDPLLAEELVAWMEEGAQTGLESLERILLSGSRIPVCLPGRLRSLAHGAEILLVGGPYWSCWQLLGEVPPTWSGNLIGNPFQHLHFQVLNPAMKPCPAWVIGEICLADRRGGETILKTGEQGRLLDTGKLEWLGKEEDWEVKLLGYPVSLSEVAACLERHPAVRAALAASRPDTAGKSRLWAWVVRHSRAEATPEELLGFLEEQLQYYMVPSGLMLIEALPRLADGGIDLLALPTPQEEKATGDAVREDGLEPVLIQIWQEVLGVERVGVSDPFYALGGDSLALVRMAVRVRERFGEDLQLWKFFREATVRGLADLIRSQHQHRATGSINDLQGESCD